MYSSKLSDSHPIKYPNAPTALMILSYMLVFSVVYATASCIYNIFFHPLRKIPGPPLARLSRLWSRLGNLRGQKSFLIHAAHQHYGPVVRVGPNELSFASPSATKEIYNTSSDAFVKEASFYHAKRVYHEEHLFSFRDPDAHKQRKKLLQRGFSQAALLDFEPHISSKIGCMLDQWARRSAGGEPLNAVPWAHWIGFDIVYHLMFDEDPGCVANGEEHWVVKCLRSWRPTFAFKEFVPQLEQWGPYVPGRVGGYFRDVREWKNYCVDLVRRWRAQGTRTPFLQNALHGKDAFLGRPLTDSELAEECMGGMFGGSGTTANTFVYVLWAVLRRPEVAGKLRRELKMAFGEDRRAVPAGVDCAKLPYLQAVINETLRCYPTIIATKPRTALRDTVVAGVAIPKGTTVGSQNYTVLRDATAFPDPENFLPERWLEKEGDELRKEAFTPFSVGPRSCIGIK
ncbi:Cytochrome P450 monooxygenase FUS8 [Lasiodiplodia hormozganensis]|uniref:Cytochrome P450 monooxygenase FUS8 n=1 Tax=Lasiodiplodia hormozganensis TaxID=869390 RepID=A0AA39XQN1_9PEZI|nr:Cytochrome P450 monooxygenase FUS8 [Lasiodiplodia hormozganensis]